jgi:hypothetical protein
MDQPTGLREILTMMMQSRYGLKPIQIVCKWINSLSSTETLSKGKMKDKMFDEVVTLGSKLQEEGFVIYSIDQILDHEKWCQAFIMRKFFTHLMPIVPEDILKYMAIMFNSTTNKKIILSNTLLDQFLKNVQIYDAAMNELKLQFLGLSEKNDLIDKMSVALKNKSNFGQGWYQDTSSSDGDSDPAIAIECANLLVRLAISRGELPKETRIIIMSNTSSDDQVRKIYIKTLEGYGPMINKVLDIVCELTVVIAELNNKCISESKSVLRMKNGITEYNQSFKIDDSCFTGFPKFLCASIQIPVTVNLTDRMSNFSNTRRNLPENGFDTRTTAVCQRMQARMHYRSLGAGISKNFSLLRECLTNHPSSSLGFFPLEPDHMSGLGGASFAEYILLKGSLQARKTRKFFHRNSDVVMGVLGDIGPSVNYRVTKNERFQEFKKRNPNNDKQFESVPDLLYRKPETREETLMLIDNKAGSQSVELSFVYDSTQKMMSGSSMFLTEPIQMLRLGEKRVKMNTLSIVNMIVDHGDMEENDIQILYPDFEIYETLLTLVQDPNHLLHVPCHHKSSKISRLYYGSLKTEICAPVIDCVKTIWFGIATKHSSTLIVESFKQHKLKYPWLADTHEGTYRGILKFESPVALHGAILMLSQSDKTLVIRSALKQSMLPRMLSQFTRHNWVSGYEMMDFQIEQKQEKADDLVTLARLFTAPIGMGDKIDYLSTFKLAANFNLANRTTQNLMLAQSIARSESVINQVSMLQSVIGGYFLYFLKAQVKDTDGNWKGDCIVQMIFQNGPIVQIDYLGGEVTIFCETKISLQLNRKSIIKYIQRNNWQTIDTGDRIGINGFGRGSGYKYKTVKIKKKLDASKMNLALEIDINGKVTIFDISSKPTKLHAFYVSFSSLRSDKAEFSDDMDSVTKKWMKDEPYDMNDMKDLLEYRHEWLKHVFNFYMKSKYIRNTIINDTLSEEIVNEEEEIVEVETINLANSRSAVANLDLLDDTEDYIENYESVMPQEMVEMKETFRHRIELLPYNVIEATKVFDNFISLLSSVDYVTMFISRERLGIDLNDDWFQIYKELIDYNSRPTLKVKKMEKIIKVTVGGKMAFNMADDIRNMLRINVEIGIAEGVRFLDTSRNINLVVKMTGNRDHDMSEIMRAFLKFLELSAKPEWFREDTPLIISRNRSYAVSEFLSELESTPDSYTIFDETFKMGEEEYPSLPSKIRKEKMEEMNRARGVFSYDNPIFVSSEGKKNVKKLLKLLSFKGHDNS